MGESHCGEICMLSAGESSNVLEYFDRLQTKKDFPVTAKFPKFKCAGKLSRCPYKERFPCFLQSSESSNELEIILDLKAKQYCQSFCSKNRHAVHDLISLPRSYCPPPGPQVLELERVCLACCSSKSSLTESLALLC